MEVDIWLGWTGKKELAILNFDMYGLERLHNYRQKVGDILHVHEMTGGILLHVKASKMNCGRSKVELILI
jgi:hypothetical protein